MNVMMKWLLGYLLLSLVSFAHAQNVHGILRVVKGDVQIKSGKTGQLVKARIGEKVYPKDVIITGKDARAKIVMVDNNELNVSPDSQIEIQHYEFDPAQGKKEVLLNVIYGKVRSKVEQKYDGKTSRFQVKTPSAVAGVRGTDFLTSYNKSTDNSQVVTFRGAVEFGLPGPNGAIQNAVSVTPGKVADSFGGRAPQAPAAMPKEQLAKMDNETKADIGSAKPDGAKNERAPSNDDKDKKDDGAKKDSAKKDDTSAKKEDGSGKKSSSTAGTSGTASTVDSSSADSKRAPSSVVGDRTGPSASGMPPTVDDLGTGKAPVAPPIAAAVPMPIFNPPVAPTAVPKCDVCNQLIQTGNGKLIIRVNN